MFFRLFVVIGSPIHSFVVTQSNTACLVTFMFHGTLNWLRKLVLRNAGHYHILHWFVSERFSFVQHPQQKGIFSV